MSPSPPPLPPATAQHVAELYGVTRMTVYRWHHQGLFTVTPVVIPSESGERDRVLFDRAAVAEQYYDEMVKGLSPGPLRTEREDRIRKFVNPGRTAAQ